MNGSTLVAGAVSGLLLGGLYALVAVGLALIFGVMRLVNIVHGELLILAAYLSFSLTRAFGLDPFLAILFIAPAMFLLGALLQHWVLHPLMHQGGETPLLATFGLSIIGQNILLLLWGADARTIATSYTNLGISLFGVRVPLVYLLAFLLTIVLIAGMQLFLKHSYLGKTIRAAAQDAPTARVMGINPRTISTLTYGLGAAIATLGGTLIGLIFSFTPTSGLTWLLKSFVIVVLAGMGNTGGVLAAGAILGLAEGIGGAVVGPGYRDMIGLLIALIVLLFWPHGLFGRRGRTG